MMKDTVLSPVDISPADTSAMSLHHPSTHPVHSTCEVPVPILFNHWKHHVRAIQLEIDRVGEEGERALAALPGKMLVIGTDLMDLYTGGLMPSQIAAQIVAVLGSRDLLDSVAFDRWLRSRDGYYLLTLADGSRWVLRAGKDERFVHVHPGRWVAHTKRVRGNVLKTAIMVQSYVRVHGGRATDVALINDVRQRYLSLSPLRKLTMNQGLAAVLDLLV